MADKSMSNPCPLMFKCTIFMFDCSISLNQVNKNGLMETNYRNASKRNLKFQNGFWFFLFLFFFSFFFHVFLITHPWFFPIITEWYRNLSHSVRLESTFYLFAKKKPKTYWRISVLVFTHVYLFFFLIINIYILFYSILCALFRYLLQL